MARRQEGVRRDIERTEAAAPNYTRGRVGRVVEDVSREFVRDTRDVAGLEAPVTKRARHEPGGQFEAEIALKSGLADQPSGPQPGCSGNDTAGGVQEVMEVEANVCQGDDHLGIYLFWFDPIHMLKLFLHRKRIW